MKRDMDLVRMILLASRDKSDPKPLRCYRPDGFDEETIGYNIHLCIQAGLLDGVRIPSGQSGSFKYYGIGNLTWDGHEFIDAAANDTLWRRAKQFVQDKGSELTIDAIKAALKAVAVSQLRITI